MCTRTSRVNGHLKKTKIKSLQLTICVLVINCQIRNIQIILNAITSCDCTKTPEICSTNVGVLIDVCM